MEAHSLKRTPIYNQHVTLGGKIVGFAGWELPVQYSGVIAEHRNVRERAGLFDVSHMGEILVTGKEAAQAISFMTCNDLASIQNGRAQYNAIINPNGGVVDDIIVYRYAADRFFICVNASNTEKDFAWFSSHNQFDAQFENLSAHYGQIALQGPLAEEILFGALGSKQLCALKYFHFADFIWEEVPLIVARTGYTGEDGFEIFVPASETGKLWERLLEVGTPKGLLPTGLGARDSLRLEACYPLHGHELGDTISAIESGLSWIVKPAKGDFIGRDILSDQQKEGSPRTLVGFFLDDPGIARENEKVFSNDGQEIGHTTSGTKTPTLNRALGMALVNSKFSAVETPLAIEVRGRRLKAHVVKKPFYSRKK